MSNEIPMSWLEQTAYILNQSMCKVCRDQKAHKSTRRGEKSESSETKEETTKIKTREMECYVTQPLPRPGLQQGWTGQEMVTHQSPSTRQMKGSFLQDRGVVGDKERSKKRQTSRNAYYVAVFFNSVWASISRYFF
ncbi:hypothetical protein ILYODFUR_016363 [Ilyodon furcidens]|uniref:Uncharacterized protein n=1 Tax=Ilyodon furcidens TaxID=33524 RepID=A0ABV0UGJ7_9TELE